MTKPKAGQHTSNRTKCELCGTPFCPDCWDNCPHCRPKSEPVKPQDYKEKISEWDIGGDIGIQVAIMLDKVLPNKYSSSFLETIEQKVADIVNPMITRYTTSLLQKEYEQGKADERERIVEGWKEPNRLAYERGKADGMEEESIGCFDHSQRDLSDYKKGLVELCCKERIPRQDEIWAMNLTRTDVYNMAIDTIKNLIQE